MAEFAYQEPARMKLGREIYDRYCRENKQGNAVSLLSDAMTVLRQLGPAGLDVWIDLKGKDGERQFIRNGLDAKLSDSLKSRQQDMDTAWAEIKNLMQALRCAKYYAKTQEKDE
jgi:hypothetical protein